MFDEEDAGESYMQSFKERANALLLDDDKDKTAYDPGVGLLNLPGAYKALKNVVKSLQIVHSKRPKANYMKHTFTTSRHQIAGKIDPLTQQSLLMKSQLGQSSQELSFLPQIDQSKERLNPKQISE